MKSSILVINPIFKNKDGSVLEDCRRANVDVKWKIIES